MLLVMVRKQGKMSPGAQQDPVLRDSVPLIQTGSSLRLNFSRNVLIGTSRRLFP